MRKITILKAVKKELLDDSIKYKFLCDIIKRKLTELANIKYRFSNYYIQEIFPEFNRQVAIDKFDANSDTTSLVWWNKDGYNVNLKNRIAFIDYLIDFYKDDKTDIKRKFKKYIKDENKTKAI